MSRIPGLKGREKVLLHLMEFTDRADAYIAPWEVTQEGLSARIGMRQSTVSLCLSRLADEGFVDARLAHAEGCRKRVRAYFLSPRGYDWTVAYVRDMEGMDIVVRRGDEPIRLRVKDALSLTGERGTLHGLIDSLKHDHSRGGGTDRLPARRADASSDAPRVTWFYGRRRELDWLDTWLKGRDRAAVIHGSAGIGKSALASVFVSKAKDGASVFWHAVRKGDSPHYVIGRLAAFLQQAGRGRLASYLDRREGGSLLEMELVLLRDLENMQALVVFDDAHAASRGVRRLLRRLSSSAPAGAKVLLVSRTPLDSLRPRRAPCVRLGGLDKGSVETMMRDRALPAAVTDRIFAHSEGAPLALDLVLAREGDIGDSGRSLDEVLKRDLAEDEMEVLRAVSLARSPLRRRVVLSLCTSAGASLDSLVGRSLLFETVGDAYSIHELLREWILAATPDAVAMEMHARLGHANMAAHDMKSKIAGIWHLTRAGLLPKALEHLTALGDDIISDGLAGDLHDLIIEIPLGSLGTRERISVMMWLGKTELIFGADRSATRWFMRIERMVGEAPDECLSLVADAELRHGNILFGRSSWKGALEHFRRAVRLAVSSGENGIAASSYLGLSRTQSRLGRYGEALELMKLCETRAKDAGRWDVRVQARMTTSLIWKELGRMDRARRSFEAAKKMSGRIERLRERAMCWHDIGTFHKILGEHQEAIVHLKRSADVSSQFGNLRLTASCMTNLGDSLLRLGRLDEAEEALLKGLRTFEELRDMYAVAFTLKTLGELRTTSGDWQGAVESFERSLAIYGRIGMPYYKADALVAYGRALRDRGDPKACEMLGRAMRTFQRIGSGDMSQLCSDLLSKDRSG